MKRRIMALATVFIMLLSNCAFAALVRTDTTTEKGAVLSDENATRITPDITIDSKYNTVSQRITYNDVEIHKYGGDIIDKATIGTDETKSTYIKAIALPGTANIQALNYTVKFHNDINNVVTIIYKNAIKIGKNLRDVRIDIRAIRRVDPSQDKRYYCC